jgi:hypothetical protein
MHMHSFARLVYLSNDMEMTAPATNHMICKMSDDRIGDHEYFTGFTTYMSVEGNQKAIIEYLRAVVL